MSGIAIGNRVKPFHEEMGIGCLEEDGVIYTRIFSHYPEWKAASSEIGCRDQKGAKCFLNRKPLVGEVIEITQINGKTFQGKVINFKEIKVARSQKNQPKNFPTKGPHRDQKKR